MASSLVGRDHERSRLARLLNSSENVLFLRGEAGIGKTALLDDLVATADGYQVVRCTGTETERDLPFAGLHQLTHALPADAERRALFDAAFTAPAPPVMALGIAVLDLLALNPAPLLIVVDDGHWLDAPSVQVLSFVARRLAGTTTRMVIAARDDVTSGFDLPELTLEPLTPQASRDLLDRHGRHLHPHHRRTILHDAAGNPLALLELPRAPLPGSGTLTRRLEQLYGARLDELPSPERDRLLLAALDGRHPLHDLPQALSFGLLVVTTGHETVFRHPLVRSAVVQAASPGQRRAAHARLAELYPDDGERRAVHLAAATVEPDAAVASALERAAVSATRRGGSAIAVTWLERAAELSPDPAERARRRSEAAYLAGQSGALRPDRTGTPAAVVNDGYVSLYRDGEVNENHWRLVDLLESGLDDPHLTERALNLLLPVSQFAADPVRWRRTDALIDRFGDRAGPSTAIARDVWGDIVARGKGVPERIAQALARPDEVRPADAARLLVCASYLGVLSEHRTSLRRLIEREEEAGAVTNVMVTLQLVMLDQIATGAWDEAERTGRRGLRLTSEHGYQLFAHTYRAYLGLLAAHRGDLAQAREFQSMVDVWGRPRGVGFLLEYAEVIGAATAIGEGDYESAYTYLAGITPPGRFHRCRW